MPQNESSTHHRHTHHEHHHHHHCDSYGVSHRLSELLKHPPPSSPAAHHLINPIDPRATTVYASGNGVEIRRRNDSSAGGDRRSPQFDESGLIIPRKPTHPIMESRERKELQRELMFNQKVGKNVLDSKCELQKLMEKRKDNAKKKQEEEERSARRNSFELRMEQLANRMKEFEVDSDKVHEHLLERQRHSPSSADSQSGGDSSLSPHSSSPVQEESIPEFLKVRAKIKSLHQSEISPSLAGEEGGNPPRGKCDCLVTGSLPKSTVPSSTFSPPVRTSIK